MDDFDQTELIRLDHYPRSQEDVLKHWTMKFFSPQSINYFCSCLTSFFHIRQNFCCFLLVANYYTIFFSSAVRLGFLLKDVEWGKYSKSIEKLDFFSTRNGFLVLSCTITAFNGAKLKWRSLWQMAAVSSWKDGQASFLYFLMISLHSPKAQEYMRQKHPATESSLNFFFWQVNSCGNRTMLSVAFPVLE